MIEQKMPIIRLFKLFVPDSHSTIEIGRKMHDRIPFFIKKFNALLD